MIGLGEIHNDLYMLQAPVKESTILLPYFFHSVNNVAASISTLASMQIWHCRLGHPYLEKLTSLHENVSDFPHINKTSHFCDIYPLAKQKRLPFLNAGNMSTHIFYLIHCDI